MSKKTFVEIKNKLIKLPRLPFLALLSVYQKTLSPDHGPLKGWFAPGVCRFYPTCSEYSFLSIKKQGVVRGLGKTVWRVLRCNPWNPGGIDAP